MHGVLTMQMLRDVVSIGCKTSTTVGVAHEACRVWRCALVSLYPVETARCAVLLQQLQAVQQRVTELLTAGDASHACARKGLCRFPPAMLLDATLRAFVSDVPTLMQQLLVAEPAVEPAADILPLLLRVIGGSVCAATAEDACVVHDPPYIESGGRLLDVIRRMSVSDFVLQATAGQEQSLDDGALYWSRAGVAATPAQCASVVVAPLAVSSAAATPSEQALQFSVGVTGVELLGFSLFGVDSARMSAYVTVSEHVGDATPRQLSAGVVTWRCAKRGQGDALLPVGVVLSPASQYSVDIRLITPVEQCAVGSGVGGTLRGSDGVEFSVVVGGELLCGRILYQRSAPAASGAVVPSRSLGRSVTASSPVSRLARWVNAYLEVAERAIFGSCTSSSWTAFRLFFVEHLPLLVAELRFVVMRWCAVCAARCALLNRGVCCCCCGGGG